VSRTNAVSMFSQRPKNLISFVNMNNFWPYFTLTKAFLA